MNATTTIKTNDLDWTHITWHNDSWISAVSPAGTGKAYAVVIVIDSIVADTDKIQFSYAPPNITSTVAPGFRGGKLQLAGFNFGADKNKLSVMTYEDNGCSIECSEPEITDKGVTCQFDSVGTQGSCPPCQGTRNALRPYINNGHTKIRRRRPLSSWKCLCVLLDRVGRGSLPYWPVYAYDGEDRLFEFILS